MERRAAFILALCACGGGGGGDGAGSVNGTIGGTSYPIASAISAVASTDVGTVGLVIVTSSDDACTQVETNNTHPNQTSIEFQLLDVHDTPQSQTTSAPAAPGTYTVFYEQGSANPTTPSVAIVAAVDAGSDCRGGAGEAHGISGTITLTTADAASGVFAGTFDVTFDTGDHVRV